MARSVINETTRRKLDARLKDARLILQDIEKAEQAAIPVREETRQRCEECIERIEKIKATYFPRRK